MLEPKPKSEEMTEADQIKELLSDRMKHRFFFSPTSQVIIQQKSLSPSALSHVGLCNEYGFSTESSRGGYIQVINGVYTLLLNEKSSTLSMPTQEELDGAIGRGIVVV